jgi:hypothetical protein
MRNREVPARIPDSEPQSWQLFRNLLQSFNINSEFFPIIVAFNDGLNKEWLNKQRM